MNMEEEKNIKKSEKYTQVIKRVGPMEYFTKITRDNYYYNLQNSYWITGLKLGDKILLKSTDSFRGNVIPFDIAKNQKEAEEKLYAYCRNFGKKEVNREANIKIIDRTPQANQLELKFEE